MRELAALLAVAVAVLAGCTAAPPADPSGVLRVMTWNVQTGQHDPLEWAPTIAAWRPDVVGLQEICAGEATALAELLRRDHGLAYDAVPGPIRPTPAEDGEPVNAALRRPCRDGADVTYGLAVLSRRPVTTADTVLLAPDDRDEQRGYQRLTVSAADGTPITVYNAHIGLAGVQEEQIRALAAAADRDAGPTVVLGDLNAASDDDALLAPLRDRFAEIDPSGRLPTRGDVAIDHVFHRGLTSSSPPDAPPVTSSDHRPLIGELRAE